jgi:hypothetical protein
MTVNLNGGLNDFHCTMTIIQNKIEINANSFPFVIVPLNTMVKVSVTVISYSCNNITNNMDVGLFVIFNVILYELLCFNLCRSAFWIVWHAKSK